MKILIIEEWSHFIPTGKSWMNGLVQLGHDVTHVNKVEDISDTDYFQLAIDFNLFETIDYVNLLKSMKANHFDKLVGVGFLPKAIHNDFIGIIDYWAILANKHDFANEGFKLLGYNVINVPLAADDKIFYPEVDVKGLRKKYDVSFIGGFGHGYKKEDIYLMPFIHDLRLKGIYAGFGHRSPIQYESLPEIYNSTKVNLNFHYVHQKGEINGDPITRLDLNGRVYEIAACRGFQISDHPNIGELFGDGIPYITELDWVDAVYEYLYNDKLREEMAELAYITCMKNHTWQIRMSEFLSKIKLKTSL